MALIIEKRKNKNLPRCCRGRDLLFPPNIFGSDGETVRVAITEAYSSYEMLQSQRRDSFALVLESLHGRALS